MKEKTIFRIAFAIVAAGIAWSVLGVLSILTLCNYWIVISLIIGCAIGALVQRVIE